MLPEAVFVPFEFIGQPLTTGALNEAFAGAIFIHNDNANFRVDFSIAVPKAAGGADFDFGWNDKFFCHGH